MFYHIHPIPAPRLILHINITKLIIKSSFLAFCHSFSRTFLILYFLRDSNCFLKFRRFNSCWLFVVIIKVWSSIKLPNLFLSFYNSPVLDALPKLINVVQNMVYNVKCHCHASPIIKLTSNFIQYFFFFICLLENLFSFLKLGFWKQEFKCNLYVGVKEAFQIYYCIFIFRIILGPGYLKKNR